jgi:hypothetical protein
LTIIARSGAPNLRRIHPSARRGSACASIRCWCSNTGSKYFLAVDHYRAQRRAQPSSHPPVRAARFDVPVDPLLVLEHGK